MHVANGLVTHARILRVNPFAIETLHVALVEPFFVVEKRGRASWCKWDCKDDVAPLSLSDFFCFIVDYPNVEHWHGLAYSSGLDWQALGTSVLGKYLPAAALRASPEIVELDSEDHQPIINDLSPRGTVFLEKPLVHAYYTRFAPLTGEEQALKLF